MLDLDAHERRFAEVTSQRHSMLFFAVRTAPHVCDALLDGDRLLPGAAPEGFVVIGTMATTVTEPFNKLLKDTAAS